MLYSSGPYLFVTRDRFHEDSFSMDQGPQGEEGWFQHDSSTLHFLCAFISMIVTLGYIVK